MERLREQMAEADRVLSSIEKDLERGGDEVEALSDRMVRALDAVWACAQRYLAVVDGLEAGDHEEVVATARHTGLLGDSEAEEALRVLKEVRANEAAGVSRDRSLQHTWFLRLWLERVRDTAMKAETS